MNWTDDDEERAAKAVCEVVYGGFSDWSTQVAEATKEASRRIARAALAAVSAGPEPEPQAGVMHPVDQAFYDLAIKERDYERREVDRLRAELARKDEELAAWRRSHDDARAQMRELPGIEVHRD